MLTYIVDEVLSFREKKTFMHRGRVLLLKLILFVLSIVIPLTTKLSIAIVYTVALWLTVYLMGLRKTVLYIIFSTTFLYITLYLVTLALGGNIWYAVRPLLVASSTLSISVLIFATLPPNHVRRFILLYLLLVTLNSVLREIRDVQIVLRARGEAGFRYYLRIFVVSIEVALSRIDVLIDSLKARGIELSS